MEAYEIAWNVFLNCQDLTKACEILVNHKKLQELGTKTRMKEKGEKEGKKKEGK